MRLHSSIPMLRIVPDDTKFDFMRFRRVSFPASAVLSIAAICLYFFVGLHFGIDFVGGTLLEVKTQSGQPADLSKMRTSLGALGLGDIQLQEFGSQDRVLIRIPQQPGGEVCAGSCLGEGQGVTGRGGHGRARGGGGAAHLDRDARHQHGRPDGGNSRDSGLSLVPV